MEGFLLGLASGTICLAYCAPVIVPYLMAEGNGIPANLLSLLEFLTGRLSGYLVFGLVAWLFGRATLDLPKYRELLFGILYVGLSIALGYYGLFISEGRCTAKKTIGIVNRFFTKKKWAFTFALGLLTGINVCPPFLLAFTSSAHTNSPFRSLFFFFMFFLGTSVYLLPIVFLGFFRPFEKLRLVGKIISVIMCFYFFYEGSLLVIGGLI